jgi:hypothetical protein
MKICLRPVRSKTATKYEALQKDAIRIDDDVFTFDPSLTSWPNIAEESGGRIMYAYRDESGEVCLELRFLTPNPGSVKSPGEYIEVEATGGKVEGVLKLTGKTKADLDAEAQEQADAESLAADEAEARALDLESIRPLRAIEAGTATVEDRVKLAEIEAKLGELRKKIKDKKGGA